MKEILHYFIEINLFYTSNNSRIGSSKASRSAKRGQNVHSYGNSNLCSIPMPSINCINNNILRALNIRETKQKELDFVSFLHSNLLSRIERNPQYSMRSFAALLETDPSLLSKILRNQRKISRGQFDKIVKRLSLSPDQIQKFAIDLGFSYANPTPTDHNASTNAKYRELSSDQFKLISEWHHYAIFELMRLKTFRSNTQWIARAIGISSSEVSMALERLARLDLVEKSEGKWTRISDSVSNGGINYTAAALRKFQKQVLQKAIDALETFPVEERDQSSMTMPINSDLLPLAKNRIAAFRRELCEFLQASGELDAVYNLGISLYPLTTISRRKST